MIFNKNFYNEIYNNPVYQKITKKLSDRSHEYRVIRFGNERIQRLQKYKKKKNIKYLDIGCGTGFVVESAKKKGWDATGIDLNSSGIDFGKKRNLNLFNCDLDYFIKNINGKKKYDVITLFDVLEHIVDPKELICKIKNILEKNGLIYSYVPNFNSASKILFGEKAHFIWPSHHLTYWTPETIVNFFKNLNLKTIFLETEGLDIEDFLFHYGNSKKIDIIKKYKNEFQFFINAGLYGKNLRIIVSNNKN
jgi:2-polyprenyl-3-methyl-5-hydroxy-6-metoxy-1,4-benzoquinol methylase